MTPPKGCWKRQPFRYVANNYSLKKIIDFNKILSLQEIVQWKKSRNHFFWRLRRLLLQDRVLKALLEAQPEIGLGQGESMLRRWFVEDQGATEVSFAHHWIDVTFYLSG